MSSKILFPLVNRGDALVLPHYTGLAADDRPERLYLSGFDVWCRVQDQSPNMLPVSWVPSPSHIGELSVVGYHKGRSSSCYAVHITTEGNAPIRGLMSCAAFLPLINQLNDGKVWGEWKFVKRGNNYLIEPA